MKILFMVGDCIHQTYIYFPAFQVSAFTDLRMRNRKKRK